MKKTNIRSKRGSRKRFLKYLAIALSIIFVISGALLLLEMWETRQGLFPAGEIIEEDTLKYNGQEYVLKENIETFLVIGLDKFEGTSSGDSYNNDKQADFLMLLVFDNNTKKTTAIHINRDTMAKVNILGVAGNKVDTVVKQIALAHTYGNGRDVSCRNTADAISEHLLGIKVNHYASLTMDAVSVFNDSVGGVEIRVLDDFTGIDDTLVKGEKVNLMGEHVLNYVRTRYGLEDSTNSTRMQRQQQYLRALYEKTQLCMKEDDQFIVETSIKMSDYIVSDRSVTQLQELGKKMNSYEFTGILNIEGESVVGEKFMEFYANEDSLKKIVIDLFYKLKD